MTKYLYKGKYLTEKEFFAIPDAEYEKEVKRRKKIKLRVV